MSEDLAYEVLRKAFEFDAEDDIYTELNTNGSSQFDIGLEVAKFHLEKIEKLIEILTTAIEAARERIAEKDSWFNECPKCGSDDLGATYSSSGHDPVGAWDFCVNCRERSQTRFLSREKDDQALIEAGEVLGI